MSLNDYVFTHDIEINSNNICRIEDVNVGIINPAALILPSPTGLIIAGPKGIRCIDQTNSRTIARDLVVTGSLLLGDNEDIERAIEIFASARTSRTASYISCLCSDLSQLNHAISSLKYSRVALIGCGGIGSMVAYLLAGACIGDLLLIDADTIEKSNINRQAFWTQQDVGKYKGDVLRDALISRFPIDLKIDVLKQAIDIDNIREVLDGRYDCVVVTADTPLGIHIKISNILVDAGLCVIGGGYDMLESIVYEGKINSSGDEIDSAWRACGQLSIAPSIGSVNCEVAGLISNRVIQLIGGLAQETKHFGKCYTARSEIFPRIYRVQ